MDGRRRRLSSGADVPRAPRVPAQGATTGRPLDGNIDSQRSLQGVLGYERFFPSRRFSLRAEAYAKSLSRLISYDVENIRVDYSGVNDSRGYATGFDVQLRAELVPGLESWVNYGFLITRERFSRPTAARSPPTRPATRPSTAP